MGFQTTFQARVIPLANRAFGHAVTLTRGGVSGEEFTANWESQEYEVQDAEGYYTKFHARDFMFDKADSVISGVTIKPREGDVIEMTENGEAKRFEVLPIGDMPACTEMPGGYRWRVHTKQVA